MNSVTLDDVARHAGVSPATVSRYLNKPDIVSERTKLKIEKSISATGYVPHAAARALASNKSRMIGAIVPSLDNTLFGHSLEEFHQYISNSGYTMVAASSRYDVEEEREQIIQMVAHGVDALLLVGLSRDDGIYDLLNAKGIPYVINWSIDTTLRHPCIGFDNHDAASKVAQYLLDLGHRDFAMISGRLEGNDRAQHRLRGIRETLAEHGIVMPDTSVIQSPFGVKHGQQGFRELMSRDSKPTAIICGSDPFAYGAIFESRIMGIDVPREVSITGFDDTWLAEHLTPALTTLRTPQRRMGVLAAEYLIARLKEKAHPIPALLDVELVVRDSCAPPRS